MGKTTARASSARLPKTKASKNRSNSPKKAGESSASSLRNPKKKGEVCLHCDRELTSDDKALYVEEEVNRIFCSEDCITDYFGPDIERLEREYNDRKPANDLKANEQEALAHLRWVTLEHPDEAWVQKSISGDLRYTLISEFQPDHQKKVWCVCICLCLKGEPSFLFLSFVTRSETLVDHFRKGEPVEISPVEEASSATLRKSGSDQRPHQGRPSLRGTDATSESRTDGLADSWTVEESVRAHWAKLRPANDIPSGQFETFENCIEETLGAPDEVWSLQLTEVNVGGARSPTRSGTNTQKRLFHFIKKFDSEKPSHWYIVIARETAKDDQIEILHHFPTKSSKLVEKARAGALEYGQDELPVVNRMVH